MRNATLRLLGVAGALGACALAPNVAADTIGLCLADDLRAQLHTEMRELLGALHGVHAALAERDFQAVGDRAARGGAALVGQIEKNGTDLHSGLPHEFIKFGRATHAAFDDLAALAREGRGSRELLPALSQVSKHCVGCHTKYRLAPADDCKVEEATAP